MNIDTHSWHYRVVMALRRLHPDALSYPPDSLCEYIRWLTLWPVMLALFWSVIGVMLLIAIPVAAAAVGAEALGNHVRPSALAGHASPFVEYVKARKRGICPLLTYVEHDS